MKILFFMSHGVFARNFEWTLEELAARGHRVHVALDHLEKGGVVRINTILENRSGEHPELTFGPSPRRSRGDFAMIGRAVRLTLDYARYFEPGYADAAKPRERMANHIPTPLRLLIRPLLGSARGRALLRSILRSIAARVPLREELRRFVLDHAPDVILVSPLVDPGSPQDDYVRCARELGVPTMLAVHSWDNLTLKGGIHTMPDRVAVWNEAQLHEAVVLHGVPASRIVVTGAVAYDHWFEWHPATDRETFCRRSGLDSERPYVLYLGSSRFIAPEEEAFVREWIASVRAAEPDLRDLQALIRPHPLNPFEVNGMPAGVVIQRSAEPLDDASRSAYFDSIYHSAAVAGVLTSGLIEAAIVDRRVHVLLIDRYRAAHSGTIHFRHLLPENDGMLYVANDYREHAAQLREAIRVGVGSERNRLFANTFLRPLGLNQSASTKLADAIEELAVVARATPSATKSGVATRVVLSVAWLGLQAIEFLGQLSRSRGAAARGRGGHPPSRVSSGDPGRRPTW